MKNIYLDTNIILDFLDKNRLNHLKSKQLIKQLTLEENIIIISEDMLSTIFYIDKNNKKVLEFFKFIIDNWEVVSFGKSVIKEAISLCTNNPDQDLEDTLQCLCAKENNCEYLITNDSNFVSCGIKIIGYDFINIKSDD